VASNENEVTVDDIPAWLLKSSLEGRPTDHLLTQHAEHLIAAGVPLWRYHIAVTALHPNHGALGFD